MSYEKRSFPLTFCIVCVRTRERDLLKREKVKKTKYGGGYRGIPCLSADREPKSFYEGWVLILTF